MIRKFMAMCLIGMFITGSLWVAAEVLPLFMDTKPKNIVMSIEELGKVSPLMQEALDELKRRQEAK